MHIKPNVYPKHNSRKDIHITTVEAYYKNSLNVDNTAKALYLHRNTVLFRLNRIKQLIGLDPSNNVYDRRLLFHILYNCKKRRLFSVHTLSLRTC